MVVYCVSHGLGNQILHYAMARGAADMRGDDMAWCDAWYNTQPSYLAHEVCRLDEYPLRHPRISADEFARVFGPQSFDDMTARRNPLLRFILAVRRIIAKPLYFFTLPQI